MILRLESIQRKETKRERLEKLGDLIETFKITNGMSNFNISSRNGNYCQKLSLLSNEFLFLLIVLFFFGVLRGGVFVFRFCCFFC